MEPQWNPNGNYMNQMEMMKLLKLFSEIMATQWTLFPGF